MAVSQETRSPDQVSLTSEQIEDTIAREIRIRQSVEIHEAALSVIFGNVMLVLIYLAVDWHLLISSGAVYGFILLSVIIYGLPAITFICANVNAPKT